MHTALKIDFPARPECDGTWYKDQVEKEMKSRSVPCRKIDWIHWAIIEAFGDACDPKENEPLNMLAENDLVTSLTIEFVNGPCTITKI